MRGRLVRVTQWLEAGRGFSAISTGLLLLPMTALSGVIIAPISRRNLVRGPVIAASIACLAGSVGVLFLGSATSVAGIVFHGGVSDHGLHIIAWIMVGVSAVLVLVSLADRTLRRPDPAGTGAAPPGYPAAAQAMHVRAAGRAARRWAAIGRPHRSHPP